MRALSAVLLGALGVCSGPTACFSSSAGPADGGTDAGADIATTFDAGAFNEAGCVDGGTGAWDKSPAQVAANGDTPHVGFDGAGNAIAVWELNDSTGTPQVWANRRAPDGTWGAPTQVNTSVIAGGSVGPLPQIAVSANGSAVVVWQQNTTGGATNVWANVYTPTGGWGGEHNVLAADKGNPASPMGNPRVAMDSKGNAVVVFEQDVGVLSATYPDGGVQIYANRYVAGTGWGGATLLSADYVPQTDMLHSTGRSYTPHVAMDDAGDVAVLWSVDVSNTGDKLQAAYLNGKSGQWTLPDTSAQATFVDPCSPSSPCAGNPLDLDVAMDPSGDGNAIVVWEQQTASVTTQQMWASRFTVASGWSSPPDALDAVKGGTDSMPRVAVDPSGDAAVVWASGNTANIIYANVLQGGAWKGAMALDNGMYTDTGGRPAVTFDAEGNAVAAWDDQANVYASELPGGSLTWGAQQTIAKPPGSTGYTNVDLAAAPPGCTRALAVFQAGGIWALAQH
jgi:hypothetical protein